jgi:hypothetical protein
MMSRRNFLAAFLICLLVGGAAISDDASLRKAWLEAPKSQGANWNRMPQLDELLSAVKLDGMARAKVLNLLGQPGYSQQDYPDGTRVDFYRLSAVNDQSLRIDYESPNQVTQVATEYTPCACKLCAADAPVLAAAVLARNRPRLTGVAQKDITMSAVEKMLGLPGRSFHSVDMKGGQAWLDYEEIWRMDNPPHLFLIVDGSAIAREALASPIGDQKVGSLTLISIWPQCLAN